MMHLKISPKISLEQWSAFTTVVEEGSFARAADSHIVQRDLSSEGVPHLDGSWITALGTEADQRTDEQKQQASYSDQLIAEVQAADALVIAAPMYNFSVPSVLKAWFDHIARAGVTFTYTDEGPKGLLIGKTAYVITTRGGLHKDKSSDSQVPFIQNILGFIGIDDIRVIYAEGLNMGGDARDKGLAEARESIHQLAA
ncbi:FMN-dependent NADH-azoreductase [Pseudomonadota bacterium]